MKHSPRLTLLALAAATSLLLASCGDDDDGNAGSPSEPTTALTGSPIKLMVIAGIDPPPGVPAFAEAVDGAEAGAEVVNHAGGIHGRPVEIVSCDSKNQPNESAACGRRAVAEHVVAVVGTADLSGGFYASLESAAIPSVANFPTSRSDFTSPMSFPIAAGAAGVIAGTAAILVDVAKSEKVSYLYTDVPTITGLLGYVDQAMALRGKQVKKIGVPPGTPDLSTYAAQATSGGVDGVAVTLGTADADKMIVALRQSGYDDAISRGSAQMPPSSIDTLAEAAENVYQSRGILPPASDDSQVKAWVEGMKRYASKAPLDEISGNAYASVLLVSQALRNAATTDSAALIAALTAPGATFDTGLYPTAQFTTPEPTNPPLPRVFNNKIIYAQIKDGEPQLVDGAKYLDVTREAFTG